ncbi:MAG: hypothetical protein HC923_02785, partial [Myxococcales bacterium]|nr:hypothetical protein [Myxococcales bacterium]
MNWKNLSNLLAAGVIGLGLAACGDDDDGGTNPIADAGPDQGNPDEGTSDGGPGATVSVTFMIDDSVNKTYTASDRLAWKGSFNYDGATNTLTRDPGWAGPYPLLHDDGTNGDQTANDGLWTVTVQVDRPATDALNFEYGAVRNAGGTDPLEGLDQGSEWIWNAPGGNGTFIVGPSDTAISPSGLTIEPFGTNDFRLTIDSAVVRTSDPEDDGEANWPSYDPASGMQVKSGAWGWSLVPVESNGDGTFTFTYGEDVVGKPAFKHSGPLPSGFSAQFVFVLGSEAGDPEYKAPGIGAVMDGITAEVKTGDGPWQRVPLVRAGQDNNTAVRTPGDAPDVDFVFATFQIDDSTNKTYTVEDRLAWKGSFQYDGATNVQNLNTGWA